MDKRAEYLIQIIEQIGSPLMRSIIAVPDMVEAEASAKRMAELLGKTVELGISMANMADLSSIENDSVRVALTGLASPLVAKLHEQGKKTPDENDLKRVTSALQAVLTFSENFTPDEDNTERLKKLKAQGVGSDAHQITVQYMQAFIPAVNAIGAFSFGQPEQKLILEVSSRLTAKAETLRKDLLNDLSDEQKKAVDLAILKALVELYAVCHEAETKRLIENSGEEQNSAKALETVWKSFDARAAMMHALTGSLLPGGGVNVSQSAPAAVAPEEMPKVEPVNSEPATAAEMSAPETQAPATPKETPAASGNPMSMFAKPKEDATSTPPPAETPAPAQEAPPAEAEVQAPQTPPPVAEPTKEESDSSASDGDGEGSSGGGPMSFFKKPD